MIARAENLEHFLFYMYRMDRWRFGLEEEETYRHFIIDWIEERGANLDKNGHRPLEAEGDDIHACTHARKGLWVSKVYMWKSPFGSVLGFLGLKWRKEGKSGEGGGEGRLFLLVAMGKRTFAAELFFVLILFLRENIVYTVQRERPCIE